ncbi:MAG: hypothetical protein SNI72_02295 [Rikenellaceae bacterium]
MKRILLLFVCLATFFTASAQKEKLLIDYFTFTSKAHFTNVSAIRNQIITGIQATSRLTVIDVDTEQSLKIEESRRMSEGALADYDIRMGEMKRLGADYLLSGNVDGVTVTRSESKSSDGKVTVMYSAKVAFTLKATNVADGSLRASETFSVGSGLLGAEPSEANAGANSVKAISSKMRKFIDTHFALEASIVEMKEAKKNKMVSCYIDLGSDHGLASGQTLDVFRIQMIAGSESKIEVGSLKLEAVLAGDISECKVSKGGEEIYKAFQNGDKLVVRSTVRGNPVNWGL